MKDVIQKRIMLIVDSFENEENLISTIDIVHSNTLVLYLQRNTPGRILEGTYMFHTEDYSLRDSIHNDSKKWAKGLALDWYKDRWGDVSAFGGIETARFRSSHNQFFFSEMYMLARYLMMHIINHCIGAFIIGDDVSPDNAHVIRQVAIHMGCYELFPKKYGYHTNKELANRVKNERYKKDIRKTFSLLLSLPSMRRNRQIVVPDAIYMDGTYLSFKKRFLPLAKYIQSIKQPVFFVDYQHVRDKRQKDTRGDLGKEESRIGEEYLSINCLSYLPYRYVLWVPVLFLLFQLRKKRLVIWKSHIYLDNVPIAMNKLRISLMKQFVFDFIYIFLCAKSNEFFVKATRPRSILVCGNSGGYKQELLSSMSRLHVNTMMIQEGIYTYGHHHTDKNVCKYCVWGEGFRKMIIERYSIPENRVVITGLIYNEEYQWQKREGSRRILFASQITSDEDIPYNVWLQTLTSLNRLAEQYDGLEFVIRSHPREVHENVIKVIKAYHLRNLSVLPRASLHKDIESAVLVISISSTVILDAMAVGIPVIVYDKNIRTDLGGYREILGHYYVVEEWQLMLILEKIQKDPSFYVQMIKDQDTIRKKYFEYTNTPYHNILNC